MVSPELPPGVPRIAPLLRRHERTGRPLGSQKFIKGLEKRLYRKLLPKKPGPKPQRK